MSDKLRKLAFQKNISRTYLLLHFGYLPLQCQSQRFAQNYQDLLYKDVVWNDP